MPKQLNSKLKITVKYIALGSLSLFILAVFFFGSVYFGAWGKVPSATDLSNLKQSEATEILDYKGRVVDKIYKYNRQTVSYSKFPEHLIKALVATEDARFYEHNGVDKYSLLRVLFKTILAGDQSSGGGSTITQQLVKNIYGRKHHGIFSIPVNKLKESIAAQRIESIYSKNEILALYLNTVPFSGNTYGIESASQYFFGKETSSLSLSESATLVGTLKANHSYNPRLFPERSQLRRDVVLTQMEKYGYLSSKEAQYAMSHPIQLQIHESNSFQRQYVIDLVKSQVESILDTIQKPDGSNYNLKEDGLHIHTTLDLKQQQLLEESVQAHLQDLQGLFEDEYQTELPWRDDDVLMELAKKTQHYKTLKEAKISEKQILDSLQKKRPIELIIKGQSTVLQASTLDSLSHSLKQLNAASLSINPSNGAILAYVGGADYRLSKYDIIKNAKRQVGSLFKPIVYGAGLKAGLSPCDYFSVQAVTYTNAENWTPQNASNTNDEDPHLNYSMNYALTHSLNTISVKVLEEAGISNTIELAKSMGVSSSMIKKPSLALGVAELNMMELAKLYSSIAHKSQVPKPYFITKITSRDGQVLAEFEPAPLQNTRLSEYDNRLLLAMLEHVVDHGTAQRLRTTFRIEGDLAGKTGTTQNNKDGWFAAITPRLVNITWVGHNDARIRFKSTRLGQGANSALPIFGSLYSKMQKDNDFDTITKAQFSNLNKQQQDSFDCEDQKRDGFFKRLFSKEETEKEFEENKNPSDNKPGFFKRLFGKKN